MRSAWKLAFMIVAGMALAMMARMGFDQVADIPLNGLFVATLLLGTIRHSDDESSPREKASHDDPTEADFDPLLLEMRHPELASLGHEYKNVFQVILGHVFLVLDGLDANDPLRMNLEQVQKAAKRGSELADRIQTLSFEVTQGRRRSTPEPPGI